MKLTTRGQHLVLLLQRKEMTVRQAAKEFAVDSTTMKNVLMKLEDDGLVEKCGRGKWRARQKTHNMIFSEPPVVVESRKSMQDFKKRLAELHREN